MDGLPPAKYDHPYDGPVIEQVLSWNELEALCPRIPNIRACAFIPSVSHGMCRIILPKVGRGGVSTQYQEQLRRHEIGHCNGWPADHPE